MNTQKQTDFVLIGARRRVGKDTLSNLLVEKFSEVWATCSRIGFADALRTECDKKINHLCHTLEDGTNASHADPLIDFSNESDGYKEEYVRPILLAYGQARTAKDPDYWPKKLVGHAKQMAIGAPTRLVVVVPDWRKPRELEYLRAQKLGRVLAITLTRESAPPPAGFEVELAPLCEAVSDMVVSNDGTLEDLGHIADEIVLRLLSGKDSSVS